VSAPLAIALVAAWGALLEMQPIPLPDSESAVFVADFDGDGRGEVAILSRERLDVYGRDRDQPTHSIALPEGAAVVDVFDAGGPGKTEIVVLAGDAVLRIPLSPAGAEPVYCFSRENQYSRYRGAPFPGVLAVVRDGTPMIALPCPEALELHTFGGELVDSYPVGIDAPRRLALGQPFNAWANQHAQLGPPEALEFRLSSVAAYKPLLPDDALPLAIATPQGRLGTPRQQREATGLAPERWPWFPVSNGEGGEVRALYARTGDPGGKTAIRIRAMRAGEQADGGETAGPERHYPGLLLHHPENFPDFDGDGFHDLLLWKSARVTPTVDNLARAATRGTWPVHIIAHAYAPAKRRFEARPMGHITLDIPVGWYLSSGASNPLTTLFLHDFNGDGRTDFGCLAGPKTLALWLSGPGGFGDAPDFSHTFPTAITSVALEQDLEGLGRVTIALRGENELYLLRPQLE